MTIAVVKPNLISPLYESGEVILCRHKDNPNWLLSRWLCQQYHYFRVGGFDPNTGTAWACRKKYGVMFHIDYRTGERLYGHSFGYVSRFQEGLAVAREIYSDSHRYHIKPNGEPAYRQRYSSVGLFFSGLADAQDKSGWCHIRSNGSPAYKKRFESVGHFCFDLAQAKDQSGCYHIKPNGESAYLKRFLFVGPFFNRDYAEAKWLEKKDGITVRITGKIDRNGQIL